MIVEKSETVQTQQNPPPAYQPDPALPQNSQAPGQTTFANSTPSFPQPAFHPNQAYPPSPSSGPSSSFTGPTGAPQHPTQPYPHGSLNSREMSNGYQPTGSLNRPPMPQDYGSQGSQQWGKQPQERRGMSAAEIGERYIAEQMALCAVGKHETRTKYGVCGIICAILLFPFGFICMFMDVEERCSRCGNVV